MSTAALSERSFISQGPEWSFELIHSYDQAIAEIAQGEFKLDTYPNQIEVIASEQMLDAYASLGLPIGYPHWSYGKEFLRHEERYRRGMAGLAYEIVINSNPCIAYLMEENTMPMQALVIAHACYGHNSFFKNNYLFQQWTNADAIIDYMVFARRYILDCERRFGVEAVEEVLDSAHALMDHGVDRYHHPAPLSAQEEIDRQHHREAEAYKHYDELWSTIPRKTVASDSALATPGQLAEPQENLLYFIEKYAPRLQPWQREVVRIVRKLAQYFYPQGQTKVMNEGWASFWHYTLLQKLFANGRVDEAFMLEVLSSHTNVIWQPPFDHRAYSGINPYALGFAMYSDLRRICTEPTAEDRRWFPDIAGGDWLSTIDFAMRNYKDESFIGQFLSPKLIRDFRLFAIADLSADEHLNVAEIHNDEGYREIRRLLAHQYHRDEMVPDIQITGFDEHGDRSLTLEYRERRGRPLHKTADEVLIHVERLWGYPVNLESTHSDNQDLGS